jgi:hypothetical protein
MATTSVQRTGMEYACELRTLMARYHVPTQDVGSRGSFDVPHLEAREGTYRVVTGSVHVDKRNPTHVSVALSVHPVYHRAGDGVRQVGRDALASFGYSGEASNAPSPEHIEKELSLGYLGLPVVEASHSDSPRPGTGRFF